MTTKVNKNLIDGFVLDTGDTMTGNLIINDAGDAPDPLTLTRGTQVGIKFDQTSFIRYLGSSDGALYYGPNLNHATNDAIATEAFAVDKSGDDMTGDLTIGGSISPNLNLTPNGASGFPGVRLKDSSGVIRGSYHLNEGTGVLALVQYDAVGATETVLQMATDGNVFVNGIVPTATSHLTRKDYVDERVKSLRFTSDGTIGPGSTGLTVVRNSLGTYTITHNLGHSNYTPIACPAANGDYTAMTLNIGINTFVVVTRTASTGVLVDVAAAAIMHTW